MYKIILRISHTELASLSSGSELYISCPTGRFDTKAYKSSANSCSKLQKLKWDLLRCYLKVIDLSEEEEVQFTI